MTTDWEDSIVVKHRLSWKFFKTLDICTSSLVRNGNKELSNSQFLDKNLTLSTGCDVKDKMGNAKAFWQNVLVHVCMNSEASSVIIWPIIFLAQCLNNNNF